MKIFISHSSKDKWAARRISDDLISLGAETFLDEKDIVTGQSIDQSIKNNLKECSDFLILLSPASLKSEWVLLELGGAIALDKNIIPILLYVGANEIPQVINLKLARDINDVNTYCKEVSAKLNSKKPISIKKAPTLNKTKRSVQKFRKGDNVQIISFKPNDVYKGELLIDWEDDMNLFKGQLTKIRRADNDGTYTLEIDKHYEHGGFIWAEEWLLPVK